MKTRNGFRIWFIEGLDGCSAHTDDPEFVLNPVIYDSSRY